MDLETREKLEALIRCDIENMPYKFRDLHAMYFYGMSGYKDMSKEEIDEQFADFELEITEQDREWASYMEKELVDNSN